MPKATKPESGRVTVPISEMTPTEFMAAAQPLRIEGTGAILVPTLFKGGASAGYRLNLASYAIPVGDKLVAGFGSANLTIVKPNGRPIVPIS